MSAHSPVEVLRRAGHRFPQDIIDVLEEEGYRIVETPDPWKETARQYAENADYWRDRLNDHKASLAIQAFTAPDEDEAVMMESLVARIADLQAKVDSLTADQPEQDDTASGIAARLLGGGE